MNYIFGGILLSLIVGFGLQYIKACFMRIGYRRARKRASRNDKWLYEF